MKKIIQINTVCNESTGKIMSQIQRKCNEEGFTTLSIFGRRKKYDNLNSVKVGGFISFWYHVIITTLFDLHGLGSYFKTKKMIKILKNENPDIIHLHNLHGYYLNYPLLMKYLKNEYKGQVFWSLHDCWAMTGHCCHFVNVKCNKYETQCFKCPNKKKYPISLFYDNSRNNYKLKKECFTNVPNLKIIVPSNWLEKIVKKSYLKEYPIYVIPHGIDLNVFKYTYDENIKKTYNMGNKKILLGVASNWTESKGFFEFIELSKKISDDKLIVLVGVNTKQLRILKKYKNILGIKKTNSKEELVKLYSMADVFINPSKEETFSLVTIEALACRTPIIVAKNTPMEEFVNDNNGCLFEEKIGLEHIDKVLNLKKYDFSNVEKYNEENMKENIINLYK